MCSVDMEDELSSDFKESEIISLSHSCLSLLSDISGGEPSNDISHYEMLSCSRSSSPSSREIESSNISLESDIESLLDSVEVSDYDEPTYTVEEDTELIADPFSNPLYDGADISIFESYILVFEFVIRHNLTAKAFSELLQLIAVHVPSSAKMPRSVYCLKKFFLNLFPHAKSRIHSYCSSCHAVLTDNIACSTRGCEDDMKNEFISIPLGPQIQHLMEDSKVWESLQERFRRTHFDGVIRDVYDGDHYRHHSSFLSHPANISLLLNTDGVAIFRSSTVSIWPIWLMINELPKAKRFLRRNMLLAGMWFSRDKPSMNTFLRPIIDDVNELYSKCVEVSTISGNQTAKAILLQCSVDLPARALVTNMKQFNGKWGCLYCNNPGTVNQSNPLHRFWPHIPTSNPRTRESLIRDAIKATTSGEAVRGVWGPTVLSLHSPFNLPWGVVIDDLHCLYLGVTQQLLRLWFDKRNKRKDFYIGNKVSLCDKRLLQICVPDCLSRAPKSLQDISHWKGSEFRNWLLFYSIPVLSGILPNPYLTHLSLLIAGILLLSSECITPSERQDAEKYLKDFYLTFADLYGETSTTMNIHLLIHLAQCVKEWGPLWAYTCFVYESMNGHLKKLFHGTRNMSKQMAFSFIAIQSLPNLMQNLKESSPRVSAVAHILFGNKRIKKHSTSATTAVVGGTILKSLTVVVKELSNNYLSLCGLPPIIQDRVQVFYRAEICGQLFYSANYHRVKRRNSYTILYRDGHNQERFGLVQYYFMTTSNVVLAVVQVLKTIDITRQNEFQLTSPEINKVYSAALPVTFQPCSIDITDLHSIQEKCLYMDCDLPNTYVVRFPHSLHTD